MMTCGECGITSDIIDKQSLACHHESPSFLTYRARLEGTSERDSEFIVSLMEEWVMSGASIIVTGVLMTVDTHCPVAISSLNNTNCFPSSDTTTDNTDDTDNAASIFFGVVVAIITIIAAVIIITGLVCHNRK